MAQPSQRGASEIIAARVPRADAHRLRQRASSASVPMSRLVHAAVMEYLDRHDAP
jgi:hypothetical protein